VPSRAIALDTTIIAAVLQHGKDHGTLPLLALSTCTDAGVVHDNIELQQRILTQQICTKSQVQ